MSIQNFYEHAPKSVKPKQIVFLLHGVGSNGRDLISLAPMWAESLPDAIFISPDAPFHCDMVPPNYPDSYQWFSLQDRDPQRMLSGVKEVFPIVEEFIDSQVARFGVQHDKVAMVGFSQGTMTSLYVAPRLKYKIAGVLGYSGALLWEDNVTQKPPIHLVHGEADDVVSVGAWYAARDALMKNGFAFSGHTTLGLAHSIDMDGIHSGSAFLKHALLHKP